VYVLLVVIVNVSIILQIFCHFFHLYVFNIFIADIPWYLLQFGCCSLSCILICHVPMDAKHGLVENNL